jgi:hypothetical protein
MMYHGSPPIGGGKDLLLLDCIGVYILTVLLAEWTMAMKVMVAMNAMRMNGSLLYAILIKIYIGKLT